MSFSSLLKEIYPDNFEQVLSETGEVANPKESPSWHKRMNLYVTYPDSFELNSKNNLDALTSQLERIKKLGCNALHILPMLESPMIDAGFDIGDYKKVRDNLGGNQALEKLLDGAKSLGMHVFTDLVLNHVSDQHIWFKKALQGEEKYRNYFLCYENKPKFIKKYTNDEGVWADYAFGAKIVSIRIIFPEFAGEIPHFVQASDGNWYYHTFYPHQIDLNWNNPELFLEFVDIVKYWSLKKLSFRLDAIAFLGKDIEKDITENSPKVHRITKALNIVQKKYHPEGVLLVEAVQTLDDIKQYFGTTPAEAELAYNFPLMNALWLSILGEKTNHIWKNIEDAYENLPNHAAWITFLRNHDELSLEFVNQEEREIVLEYLNDYGLTFRNGFGIAGRTYNMLNNNPNKVAMAYLLLASLPGSPAVIYGDEYGKENDSEYMKKMTADKKALLGTNDIVDDVRDINRGIIKEAEKAREIHNEISKILNKRQEVAHFFETTPVKLETNAGDSVFAAKYTLENQTLTVLINLSQDEISIAYTDKAKPVLEINAVELDNKDVKLGPHAGLWLLKT